MDADLSPDDFDRMLEQVAEKLSGLTAIPLERARELAGSVVGCCVVADDDGMLTFRDDGGTPVVALPAAAFESILWGEEEDEEDPE